MSSSTSTDARLSPGLPPSDVHAANANDARRFVYTWFTLFEHRAPAARLAEHVASSKQLTIAFAGGEPLGEVQQFVDWYEQLLANTLWNFHELSNLTVDIAGDATYDIAFDVDWQGAVTDDSEWPTNLPERRFRFELRQRWRVIVEPRSGLDDPFLIVNLVTEPR